jgi:hypothetical protein
MKKNKGTFFLFFTQNLVQAKIQRTLHEDVLVSPYPDQQGNKLQQPNSGFIQRNPHEAKYTT